MVSILKLVKLHCILPTNFVRFTAIIYKIKNDNNETMIEYEWVATADGVRFLVLKVNA